MIAPVGVVGFVGEEVVEPFQGAEQFGAGIEVGWGALVAPIEVVAIGLGEPQCVHWLLFLIELPNPSPDIFRLKMDCIVSMPLLGLLRERVNVLC